MTRKLEVLAIALVALSAIAAVAAPAAFAENFHFGLGAEDTTFTGSLDGSDALAVDSGKLLCKTNTYKGNVFSLSKKTPVFDAIPTYTGCTFNNINITVDPNACSFLFNAEMVESGKFEGSTDIFCTDKKPMKVTAPGCTITIFEQSPLKKVTYTNIGGAKKEITIDLNLSGITYEEDNVAPLNQCMNPGKKTNNGTYIGAILMTGEDKLSNQVDIWAQGTP
jgi:hypothetical protein